MNKLIQFKKMTLPQKLASLYNQAYLYVFYKRNLSGPLLYLFLSVFGYYMLYTQMAD